MYSVSFPSSTLPINKLGLLAWVHTFHLAIACIRLGGSLTPLYFFSYLEVARLGGFVLWVSALSPQFIHWVCPSTAQVLLWGLCPLLPHIVFVLWGLSLLTVPLCLQGASANHPITCPGCVTTAHSCCYPREHPVSIVPFTARFVLFLFMQYC